jgi:DNA N-6-adenine-methyltransferase (Dam)/Protein of unknown function (DUF3102)
MIEIVQRSLFDIAESIRTRLKRTAEDIIAIGLDLIEAKASLQHGQFQDWLQAEFEMTQMSAVRFMQVAKRFGDKSNIMLDFPATVIYELAAPSTPDVVIEMVQTGQLPATLPAIREAKQEMQLEHPILNTLTSKSNEWYTPQRYIDAAKELMGGIDIDPASNPTANEIVKAANFYDSTSNGLDKDWTGRVWLNPPYGRDDAGSNQDIWSRRLIEQYEAGITTEAVLLVNAAVDTKWFQRLFQYCEREPHFFPVCIPDHRINFYSPDNSASGSTHGSALIYFGTQIKEFYVIFSQFGLIMERMVYRW